MKLCGIRLVIASFLIIFFHFLTIGNAATVDVSIVNFAFSPQNITINVGDTVVWTNTVNTLHTTTNDGATCPGGGSIWNSGNLGLNQTFSFTFNNTGTFPYHCNNHCGIMTGTVTVINAADFSISCNPSILNIAQGSSDQSTCTVTSLNNFNSAVTLSTTGLPSGATSGYVPNPVTPPANGMVTSTMTVNVGSTVPAGTYPIVVNAVSGAITHTFNMTLNVSAGPDFGILCNPSTIAAAPGTDGTSVCTTSSIGGFSSAVDLSCVNLPFGATCAFVPNPVTPPSDGSIDSDLTVTVDAAVPGGDYPFQVSGTSGALTRTFDATLAVQQFSLTSIPSSFVAAPGGSASTQTTVSSVGSFNSAVDLSCTGLPPGITCSFTPPSITPPPNGFISSDLTVNVGGGVTAGTYPFQIIGTSGSLSEAFDVSLTVTTSPDFNITCNPTFLSGNRGAAATTTCTITSINSFNSATDLSCSNLPSNVSCSFNPQQVTPPPNGIATTDLTVNIGAAVPLGSYTVQVDATGGPLHSAILNLSVDPLFREGFDDPALTGWIFIGHGSWSVNQSALLGTSVRKSSAIAPFTLCANCTVEGDLESAGGQGNRVSLLGWYVDKRNNIELMMKEGQDKWILKHLMNGATVAKVKFSAPIDPNTNYHAAITYDGANFLVFVNGGLILTVPSVSPNPGGIGFRVKGTTGKFREIIGYQ